MALLSNPPPSCIAPMTNGSICSNGKNRSSHSSPHSSGGSRKRHSPVPGSSIGGSAAKKMQQFMLVASEAIPLKDAGMYICVCVVWNRILLVGISRNRSCTQVVTLELIEKHKFT